MTAAFLALVRRDLGLAWRQGGDTATAIAFFVLVVVLFPLGIGPSPGILARIGAGAIWIAALLAALLSLDQLLRADYEDGSLEQLLLGPLPPVLVIAAKCTAHWLAAGLPVAILAPLLALILAMPVETLPVMAAALLLGTPTLTVVGAVGAALTLGARRPGILLSLLLIPLYVPVLIFGVGAVDAAAAGLPVRPQLVLLGALLLFALATGPIAAAAAVRQATT